MTQAQRKRRLAIFGGVVLAAIIAVAVVIAVSSGGGDDEKTTSTATSAPTAAAKPASEFDGIPQKGNTLGVSTAPATLMVFADLQCPFCAEFENNALPKIVDRYVKPGKLKIVFQPIAILGNDSVLGVRASSAAALQNKMFDFNAQLYRNQGEENSGYLNQAYVKKVAKDAGLDPEKLVADLKSAGANKIATAAQNLATSGKVNSTPSFFIAKQGGTLTPLQVNALTAGAFYPQLDSATAGT